MSWTINFSEIAAKQFKKLDRSISKEIFKYLMERVATAENPRPFGKGLSHDKAGLWKYRVGDYRIICSIKDEELLVLVLRVAHRKKVYHVKSQETL